jgi:hypothetical protein
MIIMHQRISLALILVAAALLFAPVFVSAQSGQLQATVEASPGQAPTTGVAPAEQNTGPKTAEGFATYGLDDPMGGASVPQIIARILSWALPLTGSLFLAMFIWGGITYMTASGESERVKKSTQTLRNAVIGLAIVSLAYVLVFNVIDFFGRSLTGDTATPPGAPQAQSGGG